MHGSAGIAGKVPARAIASVVVIAGVAIGALLPSTASGRHYDRLLAPESVCKRQLERNAAKRVLHRQMRCMHRYARRKASRGSIRAHSVLARSALRKARDIRRCQDFSHWACGRDAFYWQRRIGYLGRCYAAAENIALGSRRSTVRSIMSSWLHSHGHRRTVLRSGWQHFNVRSVRGSYRGHSGVRFWVAHFGYRC